MSVLEWISKEIEKHNKFRKVFSHSYDGFESLYDMGRDIAEAMDERFNPNMKGISGEFQGRVHVSITYHWDNPDDAPKE
jgi:hypothetical protein